MRSQADKYFRLRNLHVLRYEIFFLPPRRPKSGADDFADDVEMRRFMTLKLFFILELALCFYPCLLFACEPCVEIFDLPKTVNQADLIVVGQKTIEDPRTGTDLGGPDWIKVKIYQILKGDTKQKEIKVNSWDGMCDFGIVVDDKVYVMFLKINSIPSENVKYVAVNWGCAVKTLLVEKDYVDWKGQKIPLKDFIIQIREGSLK